MTENGTFIINGTERVVVSQLHRSPGVFFDHDRGKTHSSGKLLYSARVIPYRGSWLDFEFDPKDCVFVRIDRRRKLPATIVLRAFEYSSEQILDMFFDKNVFHVKKNGFSVDLQAERLRGEVASFDIKDRQGNSHCRGGAPHHGTPCPAPAGQRPEASRHTAGLPARPRSRRRTSWTNPPARSCCPAIPLITDEVFDRMLELGVSRIETIYTNDLDCGPYISDTLRIDHHQQPSRSAGGNLPDDASRRAADAGGRGEPFQQPVLRQ